MTEIDELHVQAHNKAFKIYQTLEKRGCDFSSIKTCEIISYLTDCIELEYLKGRIDGRNEAKTILNEVL